MQFSDSNQYCILTCKFNFRTDTFFLKNNLLFRIEISI